MNDTPINVRISRLAQSSHWLNKPLDKINSIIQKIKEWETEYWCMDYVKFLIKDGVLYDTNYLSCQTDTSGYHFIMIAIQKPTAQILYSPQDTDGFIYINLDDNSQVIRKTWFDLRTRNLSNINPEVRQTLFRPELNKVLLRDAIEKTKEELKDVDLSKVII